MRLTVLDASSMFARAPALAEAAAGLSAFLAVGRQCGVVSMAVAKSPLVAT